MVELPELGTGQRIRVCRQRAGMTRPVLGGLVGKSSEWVKAVETGRILAPRFTMLAALANALQVPVQALIDDVEQTVVAAGPGHVSLSAVRAALNRWPATTAEPAPLEHIAARLAIAWRARHAAPDHRTVIGALLPDLIRDTQLAVRVHHGDVRRRAQALLADVLGLAQMYLAYQPAGDLLWRVVDRAVLAAQESGDLVAIATAAWFAAEAHRDAGDWDTATTSANDAIAELELAVPDGGDELLAVFGALHAANAFTSARAGRAGDAWRHWDTADAVVRRLPETYYQRTTSFSRPVMIAHAVTCQVELRQGAAAVRMATRGQAERIPSRPRQARHLIEVARGHHLSRDPAATLGVLTSAYAAAPETMRYNSHARRMTLDLLTGPADLRRNAADLATKIGLAG